MREGYAGNVTARHIGDADACEAPPHNSADALDRSITRVERIVDGLEVLLGQIAGPRNSTTKSETSTPRPVPVLARMLEQVPAAVNVQYDRAEKLMAEIRAALKL